MRIILSSVGTDGDILPLAGLGRELLSRGHRVTLVAAEPHAAMAARLGLDFEELVSRRENAELFENPDFWNPLKTAPLGARWGIRFLERQYRLFSGLAGPDAVFITNPAVFAAALACEKRGTPLISVVLQPWLLPSAVAPPVMPGMKAFRNAPPAFWRFFIRGIDFMGDSLLGEKMNEFRQSVGLPPVKRILGNWFSRNLVLAMFPEWFAGSAPDWPAGVVRSGFPLFDGGDDLPLPEDLRAFCQSGPPPVAFTFGTGLAHPAELFRDALEACSRAGTRGVFLTKYTEALPGPLPPHIHHSRFAPFRRLFPLCSAVAHHGGIGTASAAMAAGIPQVIRPVCFDQADNAARVRELGAGEELPAGRGGGKRLAEALARVTTPEIRTRCQDLRERLAKENGLGAAADRVEDFIRNLSAASPRSDGRPSGGTEFPAVGFR